MAGPNFGCGSSREHAPWALRDFGFRAVISTSIADIFFSNALKNGLVPVRIDARAHAWLVANPGAEVEVDLEAGVRAPAGRARGAVRHRPVRAALPAERRRRARLPALPAARHRGLGERGAKGTLTFRLKVSVPFETTGRFPLSHTGWESWFGMSKG